MRECSSIVGVLAVAFVGAGPLLNGQGVPPDVSAYAFSCDGRYVSLRLDPLSVSAPRVAPGAPVHGRVDGCLIETAAADVESGLLYLAMPAPSAADSDDKSRDKITVLTLPDLQLKESLELPIRTSYIPRLRLEPSTRDLLVTYRTQDGNAGAFSLPPRFVVRRVNDHFMLESATETKRNSKQFLSDHGYVATDGSTIDGNRIMGASGEISVVSGYELLTDTVRRQFASLERTNPRGAKYLDTVYADGAAGRMVFIIAWDLRSDPSPSGGGFLVYDGARRQVLCSITTPYREAAFDQTPGTPTVHLTPDGQTVVVEEYNWERASDGSALVRAKTGKLAFYAAASGSLKGTVQLDPVPGPTGRTVAFSPDSRFLYYSSAGHLHVINLSSFQSSSILLNGFSPALIVFAQR